MLYKLLKLLVGALAVQASLPDIKTKENTTSPGLIATEDIRPTKEPYILTFHTSARGPILHETKAEKAYRKELTLIKKESERIDALGQKATDELNDYMHKHKGTFEGKQVKVFQQLITNKMIYQQMQTELLEKLKEIESEKSEIPFFRRRQIQKEIFFSSPSPEPKNSK